MLIFVFGYLFYKEKSGQIRELLVCNIAIT